MKSQHLLKGFPNIWIMNYSKMIKEAGLTLKSSKCKFTTKQVTCKSALHLPILKPHRKMQTWEYPGKEGWYPEVSLDIFHQPGRKGIFHAIHSCCYIVGNWMNPIVNELPQRTWTIVAIIISLLPLQHGLHLSHICLCIMVANHPLIYVILRLLCKYITYWMYEANFWCPLLRYCWNIVQNDVKLYSLISITHSDIRYMTNVSITT